MAALSPLLEHVVLGGGQEAIEVTRTSTRTGKFNARFFHVIFVEEFGRVNDHFGPLNSPSFHADGKSYSSGGGDGYVRVRFFDPEYFDFRFEFQLPKSALHTNYRYRRKEMSITLLQDFSYLK